MIIKLPKQEDDDLKKSIEEMTTKLANKSYSQKDKASHVEYLKNIREHAPILQKEVEDIIESLKKDIASCEPKQLLEHFGFLYNISTSYSLEKDLEHGTSFKLDYLLSLITALDVSENKRCDTDTLERIALSLEELEMKSIIYLMVTSDYKGEPNLIKFRQTIHHMIVRGDSFSEHKIQLCKELFSNFDSVLIKEYSLTSNQIINELINIAQQPLKAINTQKLYYNELIKSHQNFIEKSNQLSEEETKDYLINFKDSETYLETHKQLQNIYDETNMEFNESIFNIRNTILPDSLIQKLSIKLGDNSEFQKGRFEYFPTNNSLIYDSPFLFIENKYYCFNLSLIYNCLHKILENILLAIIPPNKHQKNYYKVKSDYLEDKSLELFKDILPSSQVYDNLKYGIDDEVDGIIIYDDNLFIIESKSNKFSLEAKQGSVDRIKKNTKDIVEKAYQQALRAKNYIESNRLAEFRDKNKRVILIIDNSKIKNIYLINPTLEPLNHLSSDLSSLKEFGFIENNEWIWSVYLNDLRIISETLESPSEFLLYLDRRIKYNDYPQIKMAEELDIFGYFLKRGLYFDDIDFPEKDLMLMIDGSFSKDIESYYYWKEGTLIEKIDKPAFFDECSDNIKFLVKEIEHTNKTGFTDLTKFLLSLDCVTQGFVKQQLMLLKKAQRTDFHFHIEEQNIGITFIAKRLYDTNKSKRQCEIYAYDKNVNNWFLVVIDDETVDFKHFYYSNIYNEALIKEVERLRQFRLEQTLQANMKIGRNEPCPCASGKKYKKCCLNK